MQYKSDIFTYGFRQNSLTNVYNTAVSSQRVSDGVNLSFIPCLDALKMFCFVCKCQVLGMKC